MKIDASRREITGATGQSAGFRTAIAKEVEIGGTRFRKVIQKELEAARAVVVLWSPHSIESELVINEADDGKERVNDAREIPNRRIYCIDLRARDQVQPYIEEVKRIARENAMQLVGLGLDNWIGGSPKPEQLQRYASPTNDTALGPPVEIKSANPIPPHRGWFGWTKLCYDSDRDCYIGMIGYRLYAFRHEPGK